MSEEIEPKTIDDLLQTFAELDNLSVVPRTGWLMAGVAGRVESVAEHCFSATAMAWVLGQHYPKVDLARVISMLVLHDIGEARMGDAPKRAYPWPYMSGGRNSAEQLAMLDIVPRSMHPALEDLIDEFMDRATLEARFAHDIHGLQMLIKALMYARANNGDMTEYRDRDAGDYRSEFELLHLIAAECLARLEHYTEGRNHWSIGYNRNVTEGTS
jgi:putative hydrolase of HD superfamily